MNYLHISACLTALLSLIHIGHHVFLAFWIHINCNNKIPLIASCKEQKSLTVVVAKIKVPVNLESAKDLFLLGDIYDFMWTACWKKVAGSSQGAPLRKKPIQFMRFACTLINTKASLVNTVDLKQILPWVWAVTCIFRPSGGPKEEHVLFCWEGNHTP